MSIFIGLVAVMATCMFVALVLAVLRWPAAPLPHRGTGWPPFPPPRGYGPKSQPKAPIGRVPAALAMLAVAVALLPSAAFAADATVPAASLDLTTVVVAIVGGVFAVIQIIAKAVADSRIKDAAAREVVDNALDKSLGALQQAAQGEVVALKPALAIPGVAASLTPGVQYVLDHAGGEASRLGITPQAIADKINARIGLSNIATNLAVSASAAPVVVQPLAPVPASAAAV